MTDQPDLRIGIVGFGLRASLATWAHRPGEGSRVTVVCDPAPRGRRDAAGRIDGVRLAQSVDELLAPDVRSEVDAVLVLTPDHAHAEHAVRTLEAGLPTFVEKPLANEPRGLARPHAPRRPTVTGTRLYVGHNMRHMPVHLSMRGVIEAGHHRRGQG